jgi:hypothetical protein
MSANIPRLVEKLIDVERSIGREPDAAIRRKIQDAEDYAIQVQKELAEKLLKDRGRGYYAA